MRTVRTDKDKFPKIDKVKTFNAHTMTKQGIYMRMPMEKQSALHIMQNEVGAKTWEEFTDIILAQKPLILKALAEKKIIRHRVK